ncbi:MAG: hypothetical protein IPH78_03050 [Bacteroidetes bacterium]|nr:hypothetical protein [Bacteroidota bacterium]
MIPQIDKALITLEVAEKTTVFILLSRDGTIHRKGNGSIDSTSTPLMRGVSQDGELDALMMTVHPGIFGLTGLIKNEERFGNECVLSIIFTEQKARSIFIGSFMGIKARDRHRNWQKFY